MKKRLFTLVLAVIMLLAVAGCNNSKSGKTGSTDTSNVPVANTKELKLPDYDVKDKEVTYIVSTDFSEEGSTNIWAEVRRMAKEKYDIDFKPIVVTLEEKATVTMSKLAAGTPPSFVETHRTAAWFPRLSSEGIFVDVKTLINCEDMLWTDMKEYIDYYSIGDSSYACVTNVYAPETLYYNTKLIKNAGLTDPVELYKKGEWTWEKMLEYIDAACGDKNGDGRMDVYGMDLNRLGEGYVCSLGQGFTTIENGKVSLSPITDGIYEKFGTFTSKLLARGSKGYYKPVTNPEESAELLFSFGGYWGVVNNSTLYAKMKAGDLAIIPFPKNSEADKYYMYGITSGYAISAAGNPVGAAAVLSCYRYLNYCNEENNNRFYQGFIDEGWNKDSAHILTYDVNGLPGSYQNITLIPLGNDFASSEIKSVISCLETDVTEKQETWSSVRDKYLSRLKSAVDSANKIMTKK